MPTRIGDLLVESGELDPKELEGALRLQRETGDPVGSVLVQLGFVSERDVAASLVQALALEPSDAERRQPPDGESAVIRLLDQGDATLDFAQLGFDGETQRAFERLLSRPQGSILVTGLSGSGRTTTLCAALGRLNTREEKILNVEDPAEYQIHGVNQMQVKPSKVLSTPQTNDAPSSVTRLLDAHVHA